MDIPKNHPRYHSLMTRERMSKGMQKGLVHTTGLIAHGRGEAFDYLFGEKTSPLAIEAERAAAAALILAKRPIISVNGNVVALAPKKCISLSESIPAPLEVNLFHRTDKRVDLIITELEENGAKEVHGRKADARIPGLNHDRGVCDHNGIFDADVILVPLEDGDRCQALKKMGKKVIAIDLNPLSRTAGSADITIVDEVCRALDKVKDFVDVLKEEPKDSLEHIVKGWDNDIQLERTKEYLSKRLKER